MICIYKPNRDVHQCSGSHVLKYQLYRFSQILLKLMSPSQVPAVQLLKNCKVWEESHKIRILTNSHLLIISAIASDSLQRQWKATLTNSYWIPRPSRVILYKGNGKQQSQKSSNSFSVLEQSRMYRLEPGTVSADDPSCCSPRKRFHSRQWSQLPGTVFADGPTPEN